MELCYEIILWEVGDVALSNLTIFQWLERSSDFKYKRRHFCTQVLL